ncbi:MAG: exodeoxyribonuclease VII small subunit [Candidatus Omnitrophica bacterium]|nr:exodeoxyribonuclease VII small subunit [Candidatus Omnitrophota bacterium]MBU1854014.1 exodeoxyribonuclease VII small subunit [Candidatus Omnitrophota bacterium]
MAKELKFEEMMKGLENIIDELESGEMGLEGSLKRYEEGVKLLRLCRKRLDETKRKVELLLKKNGKFALEQFKE